MRDDGRTFARLGLLGFCAVAWLLPAAEQGHAQASGDHQYTSEDIEAGSRVYTSECALCHGANGDDVDGVNLRLGQFRSSVSDDDLRDVNDRSICGHKSRRVSPAPACRPST